MGQSRLTGLALMHIYYSMKINFEDVVALFQEKKPRKIELTSLIYESE